MWDPYAEFETEVLPNGLTVHVAHWPDRPWVAMGFVLHSGSRQDPVSLEGTAHFVEHLVSRNAPIPYPDIRSLFDSFGGEVRLGATSSNYTEYSLFAPTDTDALKKILNIFGGMLLTSRLDNFIEVQRDVILEEYNKKFEFSFVADARWRQQKSIFPEEVWLSRFISPLGSPVSIEKISQHDLQSYYDTHYNPSNMSVVCVGGLSLKSVLRALKSSPFSVAKTGVRTLLLSPMADFPSPKENRYSFEISRHFVTEKLRESAGVGSSCVIPGQVNGEALRILRAMLNKILFNEIRERLRWTYDIGASLYFLQAFYHFEIACSALKVAALDGVEEEIDSCIRMVGERSDLFLEIRNLLANNLMAIDITGRNLRKGAMGDLSSYQRIITYAEGRQDILSTTFEDVQNLLPLISRNRRHTTIIAP